MLVNLTPNKEEQERRKKIAEKNKFEYIPQDDKKLIIETGIYQCNFQFNFSEEEFEEFKKPLSWEDRYKIFKSSLIETKSTYGVADNIEQIKEYYKEEIKDKENKFVIAVTPVYQNKENAGKCGGWRWHKWGPYIGKLNPQYEYLDDEDFGDDFKYVLVFEIYKTGA